MVKGKCEDIAVYEELRNTIAPEELVLYDTVALGVFTEAYRALKKALHEESMNVTAENADEFAEKALYIQDALKEYERLLFTLDSGIKPNVSKFVELENDDVLDNAFSNFLKMHLTFTHKELMDYFEERYSEKTLLKYVGNVPIYKKRMLFEKKDIESRLEGLISDGIVLDNRSKDGKGKKGGKEKLISMPAVYAIFTGSWNPLVVYPEVEYVATESSRVLRELMAMEEAETNQAGKMLKLMFKNGSADGFIQNFAGLLTMYYEQMNEPRPEFIIETADGPAIALSFHEGAFYETVTV
ncbi:MAG: hypothetical protein N3G76_01070 [Candidatus Micrarchaeota archaeon]|nr:hypothetical protein [Candidatus Micrarchaeota archaeon]